MTTTQPGTTTPGPRDIFERFQRDVLAGRIGFDHLAPDVVIEMPFAVPGRPRRFAGRAAFEAFARPERAAFPVRFDEFRDVVVHQTADPEVIVAEYELAGTVTTTGRQASAAFVVVLRVRDGQVVSWREYQNALAIAAALDQLPALLSATDQLSVTDRLSVTDQPPPPETAALAAAASRGPLTVTACHCAVPACARRRVPD